MHNHALDARWVSHQLNGAYQLDLNVSHAPLGSIFHPRPGTLVGDLTEHIRNFYGSVFSSLSTGGTTISNLHMMATAMQDGKPIIVNRGAHASIHGSLVLADVRPHYLPERLDETFGLPLGHSVQDVEKALQAIPDASAVVLTTPNYFGRVSPLSEIVTSVHRYGALCMVDGAHGAHFCASHRLPEAMEAHHPDLITHSIHKTGAALGQASLLHCYNPAPALRARFYECLNTLPGTSTSFSTVILLSLWMAVNELQQHENWDKTVDMAYALRLRLNQIPGCRVVAMPEDNAVVPQDPTRICVDVSDTGLSGYRFAKLLAVRKIIAEMETQRHVMFIITSATSTEMIDHLVKSCREIARETGRQDASFSDLQPPALFPAMELTPRQAFMNRTRQRIAISEAADCVSAETISTYPPGAPIVVAGERLRQEDIDYLQAARASGASLKGAADSEFKTIEITE